MKELKIDQALRVIRKYFKELGCSLDEKRTGEFTISYEDALLSGLALFQLKYPSLLQYDQGRSGERLKGMFGINQAPSDTRLRELLDEVDPSLLRPAFKAHFDFLRHNRHLESFRCLGEYYALSVDGTQHFSSHEVHCKQCLEKHHKNGTVTYSHQILAGSIVKPGLKEVIPVCPEPILKQDGEKKNDCELNAFYRFNEKFRQDHPKLPCIFLLDSLFSKAPVIRTLLKYAYSHFIIGAKPGDHKYLYDWVSRRGFQELSIEQENGDIHHYQYRNNAPLNEANADVEVNFLSVHIERASGKKKKKNLLFSWVTDIPITPQNIDELTALGRARWKVENETFNTLKNQGYNFEHNFGHGNKYLSTVLAMLMMLAFAVDQFQQLACQTFSDVLHLCNNTRFVLWETVRTAFRILPNLTSWRQLYETLLAPQALDSS